jgi:potassium-transporting ATPase KdpC subunit
VTHATTKRPTAPGRTPSPVRGLLFTSVLMTFVVMIGTGLVYPLVMTGVAQAIFHGQANGSLIEDANGRVVGSSLIGQAFAAPRYFHPRPSAAGKGYDATASAGTNLGPTSAQLLAKTLTSARMIRKENHLPPTYPLPADAVSASASGLDPDISPAYAYLQAPRVARARGMTPAAVLALVRKHTEVRKFGILGEPRVNVLELNLALDAMAKK